jgi:acyl carrier protein
MSRIETAAEVRRIIAGALLMDEGELPPHLSQDTCSRWTSLYHLTIVVALEEHFGTQFTTEEILEMTGAEAIVQVLESRAPARRSVPVRTF